MTLTVTGIAIGLQIAPSCHMHCLKQSSHITCSIDCSKMITYGWYTAMSDVEFTIGTLKHTFQSDRNVIAMISATQEATVGDPTQNPHK